MLFRALIALKALGDNLVPQLRSLNGALFTAVIPIVLNETETSSGMGWSWHHLKTVLVVSWELEDAEDYKPAYLTELP